MKQQAKKAPQFVMVTSEFGYDIFIADTQKTKNELKITDKISEASIWAEGFDDTKLEYWKALTGYKLEKRIIN